MPPLQPKKTKLSKAFAKPRIVLAIDFGTTFTGLAWMETDGETVPESSDIHLFTNWPEKNEAKVPSEVSYSLTGDLYDREYRQWGFSIDSKSKVLRWTKLELVKDPSPLGELGVMEELIEGLSKINKLYDESSGALDVPRHLSKSSKDIIEYYLGFVAREWEASIFAQAKEVLNTVQVDIVVTHPAMWPDSARSTLVKAICGAFNRIILPTRKHVFIVSEPEACTLYVIQDVLRRDAATNTANPLRKGDCFTLCDAGGGTIDLVSYSLNSLIPLDLVRLTKVTGAQIGATSIDRAFLRWLETKLGGVDIHPGEYGKGGHYILDSRVNLLLGRFEVFKRSFTGTESFDLTLPRGVVVNSADQVESEARQLHISSDLMKEMFRESITGVRELITQQILQVEESNFTGLRCRVSNIFLAGGFAESGYLYNEVTKLARAYGNTRVRRADDCWSSVVKGAVLKGMAIGGPLPPTITTCKRRYGLSWKGGEQFAPRKGYWTIHQDDENAPPYNFKSNMQLIWLVDKGDVIFAGEELKKTIKLSFKAEELPQIATIQFIANGSDHIPRHYEDLNTRAHDVENLIEDVTVRLDRLSPADFERYKFVQPKFPKIAKYELSVSVELTVRDAVTVVVNTCKSVARVIGTSTSPL